MDGFVPLTRNRGKLRLTPGTDSQALILNL